MLNEYELLRDRIAELEEKAEEMQRFKPRKRLVSCDNDVCAYFCMYYCDYDGYIHLIQEDNELVQCEQFLRVMDASE